MKSEKSTNIILCTLSGLIVCIIIGFILAGSNIFNPRHLSFQFTLIGLLGPLLYSTLKYSSTRDFIFVLILFILMDVIIIYNGTLTKFIIHGINEIFIALAIFLYAKKMEQNKKFFLSNILSISGIMAFALFCAVLALSLFPKYDFEYSFLHGQTVFGLLIGFGIGIGIHIHSKFLLRKDA